MRQIRQRFAQLLGSKTVQPAKAPPVTASGFAPAPTELKETEVKKAPESGVSSSGGDTLTPPQPEVATDSPLTPTPSLLVEEKKATPHPLLKTGAQSQLICDYPRHRFFLEQAGEGCNRVMILSENEKLGESPHDDVHTLYLRSEKQEEKEKKYEKNREKKSETPAQLTAYWWEENEFVPHELAEENSHKIRHCLAGSQEMFSTHLAFAEVRALCGYIAGDYHRLLAQPVDEDRRVEDTAQLVAVYNAIHTRVSDHYRLPLLRRLALEVVEQMSRTHIPTKALLKEALVLGRLYHPEVMYRLLGGFYQKMERTRLLDVDLLEGLADLLEQADLTTFTLTPEDLKLPQTHRQQEEEKQKSQLKKVGATLKSGLIGLLRIGIGQTTAPSSEEGLVSRVQEKLDDKIDWAKEKLIERGLLKKPQMELSRTTQQTLQESQGRETKTVVEDSQGKWDNIDTLVKLLQLLSGQLDTFSASSSNRSQQVRLLKALVRVLDAAVDLQIDLQSLEGASGKGFTEGLYQKLLPLANGDDHVAVELSLYANYGIQALLRLPAESNWLMGLIHLGGSGLTVVNELTQLYQDGDVLGHLQTICGEMRDYLKIKHAPEPWYDALRFCQYAVTHGEFKALESYIFGKDEQGEPFCPSRYNPIFQLGLLKSLDALIVSPDWPVAAKTGALKLLQSMVLDPEDWQLPVDDKALLSSKATQAQQSAWEKIKKSCDRFKTQVKGQLLYFGKAHQSGWVREQLLRQLRDYLAHPQLQAAEMRAELVQPILVEIQVRAQQSPDADLCERVGAVLPPGVLTTKPRQAPEPPSRQWFISAQKRTQQELDGRIDEWRSRRLTDPHLRSELSLYVPPHGLKADPERPGAHHDSEAGEDLWKDSTAILGLSVPPASTAKTHAEAHAPVPTDLAKTADPTPAPEKSAESKEPAAQKGEDFLTLSSTADGPSSPGVPSSLPEADEKKEHPEQKEPPALKALTGPTDSKTEPPRVLLLLGRGGSGKSTFGQHVERALWKHYRGKPSYLPVFIALTQAKRLDQNLIPDHLQAMGFAPAQIQSLKGDPERHFLFILDGYDEINSHANLYEKAGLGEWPGARLMISCRPEHLNLTGDYRLEFAPAGNDVFNRRRQVEERWMAPFNARQRQSYLEKYVQQGQDQAREENRSWEGWASSEDYQQHIQQFQGLEELIGNPYMLKIVVEVLPEMDRERQASGASGQIKRIELFDVFMKQWFKREAGKNKAERAEAKRQGGAIQYHFQREDSDSAWREDYQEFCEALAAYMFKQKEIAIVYQPVWRLKTEQTSAQLVGEEKLDHFFSETDLATAWVRKGCPLTRQGVRHSFLHKLMYEYFLAKRMYRELRLSKTPWAFHPDESSHWEFKPRPLIEFSPTAPQRELKLVNQWIEYGNQKQKHRYQALERLGVQAQQRLRSRQLTEPVRVQLPEGYRPEALLMNQRPLNELEPSLIRFLVDLAQQDPLFQRTLFHWVLASRENPAIAHAAALAATVLNLSGAHLMRRDWHGVHIPGANLRLGNLAHMNLAGADLTGANLTRTWLYGANLAQAILDGVEWGEQPKLECKKTASAIAYHPQEPWLAVAQGDTIELRHRETGERVGKPLTGHTEEVSSVSFSPDGRTLASGSGDQTVRLWTVSPTGGQALGEPLTGHTEGVRSVSFSPDGRTLASSSDDKTVRLWTLSPTGGQALGDPLTGHKSVVFSVSFSPDGRTLASGGMDNTVRLWTVSPTGGQGLGEPLTGHTEGVRSVSFSPDGRTLASSSDDKTVRLWTLSPTGGQALGDPLTGHTEEVMSVSFSPDGRTLASGSKDKTVRLWVVSPTGGQAQGAPLTGHQSWVNSVSFSPDGRTLASSSENGTVRLWTVSPTGGQAQGELLTGHKGALTSVSFSPDGRTLVSSSWDHTVRLWTVSPTGGQALGDPLTGHKSVVFSVSFSPDGRTLASSSDDKTVRLWRVSPTGGQALGAPLTGHTSLVMSVSFSPDGRTLASSSADKTVRLWTVSPTGGEALGKPLTGHTDGVFSVSFSPDSRTLASSSRDKTVRLWTVSPTGGQAQGDPLTGHTEEVMSVSFSPDGRTLASGSVDKTVRLWSVASHRCLAVFSWWSVITSIAFQRCTTPFPPWGDGQLLAMADENGVVSFWWLSAGLFRETEQQADGVEIKDQPSISSKEDENEESDDEISDDERDDEISNDESVNTKSLPQPSASEWRLLSASRSSGIQLWTLGVQLSGCRMSLMSQRLLQQTGADVSGVIVSDQKLSENEVKKSKIREIEDEKSNLPPSKNLPGSFIDNKDELDPRKFKVSTLISPPSVSTSSHTSMSSSSAPPSSGATESPFTPEVVSSSSSRLTVSSLSTAILTTGGSPSLLSPPGATPPPPKRRPPPIPTDSKGHQRSTSEMKPSASSSSSAFLPPPLNKQLNSRVISRSASEEVMSATRVQNPTPQPPSGTRSSGSVSVLKVIWNSRSDSAVSATVSSTTSTPSQSASVVSSSTTQTRTPGFGQSPPS